MILKRVLLLLLLLAVAGCNTPTAVTPPHTPTAPIIAEPTTLTEVVPQTEPTAVTEIAIEGEATAVPETDLLAGESVSAEILISEVLIGAPGANNLEFIELYNAGDTAVDLNGWSLWYQNRTDTEELPVVAWTTRSDVPPAGHYLLVRQDQDLGILPDALFSVPLSERKGGLILRDETGTAVDKFGWGEAPEKYVSGTAVVVTRDGSSMERLPGGEGGNGVQSNNNSVDFYPNSMPNPQNSGSIPTPLPDGRLTLTLSAPDVVEPGMAFDYQMTVSNQTGAAVEALTVSVPVADHFEVVSLPQGAIHSDGYVTWMVNEMAEDLTADFTITLRAPYTYVDTPISGYYAETAVTPRVYGPLSLVSMAGGTIPIAAARDLAGQTVVVEGLATMYTGGFFAGSTSTKFYIEDESGGIQVFVPGGMEDVVVEIGDKMRVTGVVTVYRDSLELIPDTPADVELIRAQAAKPIPIAISISDNENKDNILGRLNTIAGTATRIDEFSFSYEVDLTDDDGNTTLVYIEKDTGVTAEPLTVGEQYLVAGISEFYSSAKQIKPRLQSDIKQVFPPELRLEVKAENSINSGELLRYDITASNYTNELLTQVLVTADAPFNGVTIVEISDGGVNEKGQIVWTIDTLAGKGGNVTVSYSVQLAEDVGEPIEAGRVTAVADQLPGAVEIPGYLTFVGSGVPIWAIQGAGERSPYVGNETAAEGVVTGVFPELQGFWIQEALADDDPATSEGVFVLFGNEEVAELPVNAGDLVQLKGQVREISGQTTLHVADSEAITLLSSDDTLPTAVPYDPPQADGEAVVYKEALEGMLVAGPDTAVAIAPTTKFGETVLLNSEWGVDSVRRGEQTGHFIIIDDGSTATHLEQETMALAMKKGDEIKNVVGPLAYTFDQFKIEPISEPGIVEGQRPLASLAPIADNQFSIATFNVENFFDRFDPHPSDPPKPNKRAYALKLNKLAETILRMGTPTIIGLQEVENINVLQDLAAMEQLAPFSYVPYLVEGLDSRGIDVGYLVRGDQVTVTEAENFPEPTGLTSRPPLLLTATINIDGVEQTLYILNNHFSSLASGEAATEPQRTGQAAWNVSLIEDIRAQDPAAQFIVLGDLNSFRDTPPLDTLEAAGLHHVYDFFDEEADIPYTYIFQGATQTLDHILVSEGLFAQLDNVTALPINADYPPPPAEDDSAQRVSDHDPLIAVFSIQP